MNKFLQFGLLFAAFCALFGRADAADDTETRSIPIDARVVRVKLDGVIDLKLRQGDVPSLRLIGERRYLEKLTASQSGDTLHLETEGRGMKVGRSTTRAELVLPSLRQVVSEGVGQTEINGFSGEELELTMDGAGSMKVVCDYKAIKANDPDATVLVGGIAFNDLAYFEGLFANGAGNSFDGVAIHPYTIARSPWDTSSARYTFAIVWASTPCAASTTRIAPSHAASDRETS